MAKIWGRNMSVQWLINNNNVQQVGIKYYKCLHRIAYFSNVSYHVSFYDPGCVEILSFQPQHVAPPSLFY